MGIWMFDIFGLMIAPSENFALFWSRIFQIGMFYIAPTYFHFLLKICKDSSRINKRLLTIAYFFASVTFLSWFDHFKPVFMKYSWGYWPVGFEPVYFILFVNSAFFLFYGLFFLNRVVQRIESPAEKTRLLYFFAGAIFGVFSGSFSFLPTFGIGIYPFGPIGQFLYLAVVAYAIIKYRFMDITVAITRTGIFVLVYTVILGLPFLVAGWAKDWLVDLSGSNWWMWPLGLMAALATLGPFIYIYVERKAEEALLREQRRYQETLKQASVGMTRIRDLHRLLDLIAHIVTKTVRISYAAIYLQDSNNDKYILQVSRDKGRISLPEVSSDNVLINNIRKNREPLVFEEIKRQMEDTHSQEFIQLEEQMRLLTASVIIPSFFEDKLMGFIVLGDKVSGQIYTAEDLNVFQILASQAAMAIENAQFYEETKQMQEQVGQAEKMATIGTMADGLSHQINNRFYALSLIAGDTIDTIKLTDTSKCTPEIKEMIESINRALQRIQSNVIQGGEVVKGILKYTRKGEENLEDITLDKVLDQTLEMVQYKVKLSEIDIVRNYPQDKIMIRGNAVQLQEAFFNFIDNANDAITERKTTLKEEGYRGRITISAVPKEGHIEVIVEDNGIGVKESDLKKVFTPFFTTKTSSRKGTGLGLYVIHRIITEMHKGKIGFESEYKVGTRFILELPAAN